MIADGSSMSVLGYPVITIILIFFRVSALCFALPGYGERFLSVRTRLLAAILLTLIVFPACAERVSDISLTFFSVVSALFIEVTIGLFLGLFLRLFILCIQTAGAIAAQSTSLAQIFASAGADPLPAIGHVLTFAGLALLMVTGFHVKAAGFLILSYEVFPPLVFPSPETIGWAGSDQVAKAFRLAFSLAAPFVILAVIYNLTLGVINRAMPQLMVAFVGAPLISFGSIAMFFLCAPVMLQVWVEAFDLFLFSPFGR